LLVRESQHDLLVGKTEGSAVEELRELLDIVAVELVRACNVTAATARRTTAATTTTTGAATTTTTTSTLAKKVGNALLD
jgi:hypothetical protein